jgi:hypothetical protein
VSDRIAIFAGRYPLVMDVCTPEVPAGLYVDDVLVKCHVYSGMGEIVNEKVT